MTKKERSHALRASRIPNKPYSRDRTSGDRQVCALSYPCSFGTAWQSVAVATGIVVVVCFSASPIYGVDIPGVVKSATDKYATVVSDSDSVPLPGDKAAIYFKPPDSNEEVSVAKGHVYEITGPNIMVQIDQASGSVTKDQLVRVSSLHPKSKSELATAEASPAGDTSKEIEDVIRKISDAWGAGDVATLDRLIAPEYTHHDIYGGVQNRSQWFEATRNRRSKFSASYDDLNIKVYGSVAVATGHAKVEASNNPGHPTQFTFTQVFIQMADGWKRAFFQGTTIPSR